MNNYVENDVFNFGNTDVNFDYSVENKDTQNVDWSNLNSNNSENDNVEIRENDSLTENQNVGFYNQNDFNNNFDNNENIQTNGFGMNNLSNGVYTENLINPFVALNSDNIVEDAKNDLAESKNAFESFDTEYANEAFNEDNIFGMDYIEPNEQSLVEPAVQTIEELPVVETATQIESEQPTVQDFTQEEPEHPIIE